MQVETPIERQTTPWLEYFPVASGEMTKLPLDACPLTIGRCESCEIVIDSARISRRHAEIECRNGQYLLKDLQSTNGTCLNGRPISEEPLHDGDMICVADSELNFCHRSADSRGGDAAPAMTIPQENARQASRSLVRAVRRAQQTLVGGGLRTKVATIIDLKARRPVVYEVAGVAASFSHEISNGEQQFIKLDCPAMTRTRQQNRLLGVEHAQRLAGSDKIIVNIETSEIDECTTIEGLVRLRDNLGNKTRLYVAIPDRAVSEDSQFDGFVDELRQHKLGVVFDGFVGGTNQLRDRCRFRPDFVKLAPSMAAGLERNADKQERLRDLVLTGDQHQCTIVATNIETDQQAQHCLEAGCILAQGPFAKTAEGRSKHDVTKDPLIH